MNSSANNDLRVLVLAPFGKDGPLIASVLRESEMNAVEVGTLVALAEAITQGAGACLITEEVLQDSTIGVLAKCLAEQPPWSDFPVIVLTGGGSSTAATEIA